jgi:hypothetical protein
MSSTGTEDQVVLRVLESFQVELRGLRGGWFSGVFIGDAPSEGYARQLSELDAKGRMTGSVLGVWRITNTEIVGLPASSTIPRPAGRSGMYYDWGTCVFVIAPDRKTVVVSWQVGPRFGRGFQYEVVSGDNGQPGLRLAKTLWIS